MPGPGVIAPDADVRAQLLDTHLARAGELLRGEQIDAADREVAEAIQLAPDDPRAKNLLGLVRFRAGRYEDAWQVFRELCTRDADDSALRLNLGLVELRMGRHAEAAQSLKRVVEREPGNSKAQGYLGLALMRAGDLAAAREAFVAAGQQDLVRQVDEQLAAARPNAAPSPSSAAAPVARPAGDGPVSRPPRPTLQIDPEPLGPGAGRAYAAAAEGLVAAIVLGRFVDKNELRVPAGEPFAVGTDTFLVIRIDGRMHTRTTGAVASSGRLAYAPITRRVRGRVTDEPFGDGDDAVVQASGAGMMVVAPRGGRFTALRLTEAQDVLYLREPSAFAFEENLSWENGRVPGAGPSGLAIVQFRGQGRVVMRSRKVPSTLRIAAGEVFYVEQTALLGWIGQVVPQQLRGADGEPTQFVSCTGDGSLILEEPAPVLEEIQSIV